MKEQRIAIPGKRGWWTLFPTSIVALKIIARQSHPDKQIDYMGDVSLPYIVNPAEIGKN